MCYGNAYAKMSDETGTDNDIQEKNKKNMNKGAFLAYPNSLHWTERSIPGLTITTAFVIWLVVTTLLIPMMIQKLYYCSHRPIGSNGNVNFNDNNNDHDNVCVMGQQLLLIAVPPINALGWSILFFNNLNILIAFCEIALGQHIGFIRNDYQRLLKEYRYAGGNDDDDDEKTMMTTTRKPEYLAGFAYLTMPLSWKDVYDGGQKWARMWSTYSLWDPSYSNPESFGFFIDVGNGWSTIIPCCLWNYAIWFPKQFAPSLLLASSSPSSSSSTAVVLLGFIGACSYWQILYGTIIYFLSFVWNKRYKNKPLVEVLGFVGFANGIWFFFPILCLWASYKILLDRNPESLFWG